MDNKKLILIIAIILILLFGGGFWYWQYSKQAPEPEVSQEPQTSEGGLGAQIFEKAQNPVAGKVPETNPFEADLNPFKKETNPLRAIYTNPFGE